MEKESRFTRRKALLGGIGLTAGLVMSPDIFELASRLEGSSDKVGKYLSERGFPNQQISKERLLQLSPIHSETPLTKENGVGVNIVNSDEILAEISLDLSGQLAALQITDGTSTPGELSVIGVNYNDFDYLAPIVGTVSNQSTTVNLGRVSGSSTIKIVNTAAGKDSFIPQGGISLYGVSIDPLYEAIVSCTPTMGMRRDNYLNLMSASSQRDEAEALTNDMLLDYLVDVRENSDGDLALIYWALYSAEDGGVGVDPVKLYNDFGHRVYDLEIVQIAILNNQFRLIEVAHQEDNGSGSHQMALDFFSKDGVSPSDHPIHSVPNHGLVKKGFEKVGDQEIRRVFRPFPKLSLLLGDQEKEGLYWGARVIGLKENIRETLRQISILDREQSFASGRILELHERLEFLREKLDQELDPVIQKSRN